MNSLSVALIREGAIEPGESCVAQRLLCQLATGFLDFY